MASPWLTDLIAQHAHTPGGAQDTEARRARVYAAYQTWAQSEAGRIMIEDMILSVLLQPCTGKIAEGERRFVLKMLQVVTDAEGMGIMT